MTIRPYRQDDLRGILSLGVIAHGVRPAALP